MAQSWKQMGDASSALARYMRLGRVCDRQLHYVSV